MQPDRPTQRSRRTCLGAALLLWSVLALFGATPARAQDAAPTPGLRVQVRFSGALQPLYALPGARCDEPLLPSNRWTTPPLHRLHAVLLPTHEAAPDPPRDATVTLRGYAATPRLVTLPTGSTLRLRSEDDTTYAPRLEGPGAPSLAPLEGDRAEASVQLNAPGRYTLRDANYPFLRAYVIVAPRIAEAPAQPAGPARATFTFDAVPRGAYTLRIVMDEAVVHERSLDLQGEHMSVDLLLEADELRQR